MKKIKMKPPKHELGYTQKEVDAILEKLNISKEEYNKKFGVNTCAVDEETGEALYYPWDVELAIRCCQENRDKCIFEWD